MTGTHPKTPRLRQIAARWYAALLCGWLGTACAGEVLPPVDWNSLADHFSVSSPHIEATAERTLSGRVGHYGSLVFVVEARAAFFHPIFLAHFEDADGIDIGAPSPVVFEPYDVFEWKVGVRRRARVILPDGLSAVRRITFKLIEEEAF